MIGYDRELTCDEDDLLHGIRERDDWHVSDDEVGDWCCDRCGQFVGRWLLPDGTEATSNFYAGGIDTYCVSCYEGPGW